ncbi:alpha/beta hydrolase [Mycobacterium sp.]|uniref:alpha/beta fold hydrolase n=1 Tax=Mycobacterium sp. TaxID=1785 RepID=UPI002CB53052|nr:alpha/beta hydrolase [Mycobacterium sp.]HTQ19167.1 alpha/beta hydrolase [Mycobacterium sp.]
MYSFPHDNVTVTVHPARQDRHTVVLINGLFGGGWAWEPVVAALNAHGHGTVLTTEPLATHATSEDIPALLQSISLLVDRLPDPAPVLCGNSLGGLVAMELAAADPSRWSGVILTGAPGLGDEQDAASFGSALRTPSLKLGYVLADRLIHKKELITPELIERCTQALTPRIMLRAGRALRATKGYDARPLFDRIDCPVLLLCGACDEVSPAAKWRDAATMFPDAEFVEIPRSGHSPMIEEPDLFATAMLDWLDGLPAPTAPGLVLGAG